MSHITLAQQGLAAVEARDWDEASKKLSIALQKSQNPAWLIARSRAQAGLQRYQGALEDANLAWHKAYDRNARLLMAEAHYRRAVAHFSLEQHANADACCIYAMRIIKGHPAVEKEDPALQFVDEHGLWKATAEDAKTEAEEDVLNSRDRQPTDPSVSGSSPLTKLWRMASATRIHVLNAIGKLPEDDAGRKLTIVMKPELKKLADISSSYDDESDESDDAQTVAQPATSNPPVPSDMPLRIQDFQNNTTMSVSIFSKGVNKDQLAVEFLPSKVRLGPVIYPNGDEKEFQLDLWGEIDPSTSKYTVTPNKVELSLTKKVAGKWPTLAADDAFKAVPSMNPEKDIATSHSADTPDSSETAKSQADVHPQASSASTTTATAATTATASTYPTSSLSGPKNWDSVGADEGSDDEKDVNHFFKQLYKNASPEQQRAMMKSFTESNGTSLSTDWNDVKDRKVVTVPPEGVEAKKWE